MKDGIDELIAKIIERLRAVSDCDAVIGRPVTAPDGTSVIPVSKVTFGFVAGGGEYGVCVRGGESPQSAAASGGGMTVTPMGFLICGKEQRFIPLSHESADTKWKDVLRAALKAMGREKENE